MSEWDRSELVNFRHKQICRGRLSAGRKNMPGGGDLCLLIKQICWRDFGKEKYAGGGGLSAGRKIYAGGGDFLITKNICYTREISRNHFSVGFKRF